MTVEAYSTLGCHVEALFGDFLHFPVARAAALLSLLASNTWHRLWRTLKDFSCSRTLSRGMRGCPIMNVISSLSSTEVDSISAFHVRGAHYILLLRRLICDIGTHKTENSAVVCVCVYAHACVHTMNACMACICVQYMYMWCIDGMGVSDVCVNVVCVMC